MNRKGFSPIGIIIGLLVVVVIVIWLSYGTLSPCDMLKKAVAKEAAKSGGGQFGYVLFGGFVDQAIDTLSPVQCMGAVFKISTGSNVDDVLKGTGLH